MTQPRPTHPAARTLAAGFAAGLAAALALAAGPLRAEPMWDIAPVWDCDIDLHIKIGTDGSNPRINEESGTITYDFAAGTRSSAFVDAVATLGELQYWESRYGGFNLIETRWDGESYPVMVVENDGAFWQTSASGYARGEAWIVGYRCRPRPAS